MVPANQRHSPGQLPKQSDSVARKSARIVRPDRASAAKLSRGNIKWASTCAKRSSTAAQSATGASRGRRRGANSTNRSRSVQNQATHAQVFYLLLLDEQLRLNADANALLRSNEQQLAAMLKSGTASAGDFENVKAERLSARTATNGAPVATANAATPAESFCGIPVDSIRRLPCPICHQARTNARSFASSTADFNSPMRRKSPRRPTLAATWVLCTRLLQQSSLNLFEDMMKRRWSWNGIAGLKLAEPQCALHSPQ